MTALLASPADLSHRLNAVPYMSDPNRFRYLDSHGNEVLGFRTRRAEHGDVYPGFEEIFRGTEAFVRDRLRVYVPLLRQHERIVDIGCGRGELLDLLRDAAIPVVGVDVDESMVRHCRQKGHTVERSDAISYLKDRADASVPAIFSAQLVEHLSYDDWLAFLELSSVKLKPGGQLVMETVNPHALQAMKTFWTDLTHRRPIFPEVAVAWCWLFGFEQAYVFFPNGCGELDRDRAVQGEYAVVATKGMGRTRHSVS
jgi:2-polyprenyl-3-methyl-5-hydroxy-6-metoxy-1,4-benzoquinol methylase